MPQDPNDRYALKENEPEARERIRAFWAGSSMGRPILQVTAPNPDHKLTPWQEPALTTKEKDFSPEWHVHAAVNQIRSRLYLAESMPGYTLIVGFHIPLLAALCGGDYRYGPEGALPEHGGPAWILPYEGVFEKPLPEFDPEAPKVQAMVCCIDAVCDAVGDLGLVGPPAWIDAMSTLGELRTQGQLCLDMLQTPDRVIEWTHAATTLLLAANTHFYEACKARGQGETLNWLGILAEGKCDSIQCDFSVLLSPESYRRFVAPNLGRQSADYDLSIYHLDGHENMQFLDQIVALPGLTALQYTRVVGAEYPGYCLDDYRIVRDHGLPLHIHCATADEAVDAIEIVGPDGLSIQFSPFKSLPEAEKAIRRVEDAC